MANPRIDELRRRLDREPGSRLFGQLAEELRKDGELVEAIRVARVGLAAHPNYPSARMTLGRALFDTGDLAAARGEFELVLRGAPDNILASRMLAECLEGLGDPGAALLQFRAALRLAPGDRQTELQIKSLEQRLAGAGGSRPAPPPVPSTAAAPAPSIPQPPPVAPQGARPLPPPPPVMAPPPPMPRPPAVTASVAPPPPPAPTAPPVTSAPPAPPRPAPVADPAADFDDVFETTPSWQRASGTSSAPDRDSVLVLEDEAPTLPGSSHVPPLPAASAPAPGLVSAHAPAHVPAAVPAPEPFRVEPPPPPVLAPAPGGWGDDPIVAPIPEAEIPSFGDPPPVSPQAPLTLAFEPTPVLEAVLAADAPPPAAAPGPDTLAGAPAYAPGPSPAHLETVMAAPAWPEPPATPPPSTGIGESTAAFAALSASLPLREAAPEESPSAPQPIMVDEAAHAAPSPALPEGGAETPALSTSTLAELYFDQGFSDKAIQVYEELLEREPQNERARARLIEIKGRPRPTAEAALPDPRAERRLVLERKIARLEQMLAAVRRG